MQSVFVCGDEDERVGPELLGASLRFARAFAEYPEKLFADRDGKHVRVEQLFNQNLAWIDGRQLLWRVIAASP